MGHPATVALWKNLERCFVHAVTHKTTTKYGHLYFSFENNFLRIKLPSGRYLCYFDPRKDLSYYSKDPTSRQIRTKTYGGKLAENVASGMARDVLYASLKPLRLKGYDVVMLVHDEIIAEAPDTEEFNAKEVARIMTTPLPWAPNLPLAAAGFESYRYKGK